MADLPANLVSPFSLTLPVSARVGEALESVVHSHAKSMRELQLALAACVDELRAQGMQPESALLTMKAFVRQASKSHPPPGRRATHDAADLLMDQIVTWCIKAYFQETERGGLLPPDQGTTGGTPPSARAMPGA